MRKIIIVPIILFTKILNSILKYSGKGSGTALPGLIIDKYFPWILKELLSRIPTVIAITGTNGKTTTQTILRSILEEDKSIKLITNKTGANLSRGILSELLRNCNNFGKLDFTHAIFEIEEATFPKIAQELNPKIIVVTNLYRDQLDAYGEIDTTEKHILNAIKSCPNAKVILNFDDPRVSKLTKGLPNETYYVSLPNEYSKELPYEGLKEDQKNINIKLLKARNIIVNQDLTTSFDIEGETKNSNIKIQNLKLSVPGYFHTYNALFAISVANLLGLNTQQIVSGIKNFAPAFGRGEVLTLENKGKKVNYRLLLIKNPAGFSLNLELIDKIPELKLLICINDNTADGKDVSWIWDSKLEKLNCANISWIMTSGIRAKDMTLRLKYAIDNWNRVKPIQTIEEIKSAISMSFEQANNNETIFVLPTYTAMLEFRKQMGKSLEN